MFLKWVLVVMIMDIFMPFLIAIPYKEYSHTRMLISILGGKSSPLGRLYSIWLIVSGCIMVLFGYSLFTNYNAEQYYLALMLFILLALHGIADEVISGFFPLNEEPTLSSRIHVIGSTIGALAMQLTPLILAVFQFKGSQKGQAVFSIIFFVLSLFAGIVFVVGQNPKFNNTIFALAGLWQRVMFVSHYAPFIIWIAGRL